MANKKALNYKSTFLLPLQIFSRFKSAGRKIIMAEVYWNDGAKAIFDNFVPPGIVHTILSTVMGRSLPEDRAYLESVAGCMYTFIYYKYDQILDLFKIKIG